VLARGRERVSVCVCVVVFVGVDDCACEGERGVVRVAILVSVVVPKRIQSQVKGGLPSWCDSVVCIFAVKAGFLIRETVMGKEQRQKQEATMVCNWERRGLLGGKKAVGREEVGWKRS
jgi:hypothetical protein